MHHLEFWRIEETASIQRVRGDEIAPLRTAKRYVKATVRRAKAAVRGFTLPTGFVWPRPERVVTLMTKLVLSPNSAGGAPEITSSDWIESTGIWFESTL